MFHDFHGSEKPVSPQYFFSDAPFGGMEKTRELMS